MKNLIREILCVLAIIVGGLSLLWVAPDASAEEGQSETYYSDDMYIDSIKVPSMSDENTVYAKGSYYEGLTETQARFVQSYDSNAPKVTYKKVTTSSGYTYIYEMENGKIIDKQTVAEPAQTEGEIYKQDSSPTVTEFLNGEEVIPVYGKDSYYEGLTETEKDWFNGDLEEQPDPNQFVINE